MRNLFILLIMVFSFPAFAQTEKPAEILPYIKADAPHGVGTLSRLWITGYDASLWLDAPQWSMDVPFALSLRYHIGFTSDEVVERTIKEMNRIPEIKEAELNSYPAQLEKWFPDVHEGDRITAIYIPNKGTSFYHNQKLTGKTTDKTFAKHFFAIWLGPNTSEPKLRLALLKLKP